MNPRTKKFSRKPCVVCGFTFSDEHHLYPRSKGGKETIFLCPNHHRFANIVQVIMGQGGLGGERLVRRFASRHFDSRFNAVILESLIGDYIGTAADLAEGEWVEPVTVTYSLSAEQKALALSCTLKNLGEKYA
jgi:hypothetical protein